MKATLCLTLLLGGCATVPIMHNPPPGPTVITCGGSCINGIHVRGISAKVSRKSVYVGFTLNMGR